MIENLNLLLLCGGHHICDHSWDKAASELDQCFKFYFPVQGGATLETPQGEHHIQAGNIYFISGFQIQRQYCKKELEIYWIHFMPDSLQMRHAMTKIKPFHAWDSGMNFLGKKGMQAIDQLFPNQGELINRPRKSINTSRLCQVNALLLHLLSDLFKTTSIDQELNSNVLIQRIKPSIDFINSNIHNAPTLAQIAEKSNMAPNYFHRVFKKIFGVTPLYYITKRRLDIAKQLLTTSPLTVKEVAYRLGFENEFYFSRVFKKHLGISPSEFRTKSL